MLHIFIYSILYLVLVLFFWSLCAITKSTSKNSELGGIDVAFRGLRRNTQLWKRAGNHRWIVAIFIAVVFVCVCNISFAAEKLPKYQVVVGGDEKAYLVDTTTGFVWILTHRTLTAGREPVAIPYKFIRISPKNQKDFMVEDAQPLNGAP